MFKHAIFSALLRPPNSQSPGKLSGSTSSKVISCRFPPTIDNDMSPKFYRRVKKVKTFDSARPTGVAFISPSFRSSFAKKSGTSQVGEQRSLEGGRGPD